MSIQCDMAETLIRCRQVKTNAVFLCHQRLLFLRRKSITPTGKEGPFAKWVSRLNFNDIWMYQLPMTHARDRPQGNGRWGPAAEEPI